MSLQSGRLAVDESKFQTLREYSALVLAAMLRSAQCPNHLLLDNEHGTPRISHILPRPLSIAQLDAVKEEHGKHIDAVARELRLY